MSMRARLRILAAVVAVGVAGTAYSVLDSRSHGDGTLGGAPTLASEPLPAGGVESGQLVLFRNTHLDKEYGKVALVPAADLAGPRSFSRLDCDRAAFSAGKGVCLIRPRRSPIIQSDVIIFDGHFTPLHTSSIAGYPSRAQVSPDGKLASVTTFVSGDNYATIGQFSTRTEIIDTATGDVVTDLEKLTVRKNGTVIQAADFNFWGVTFAQDPNTFYATLGTGDATYLIRGDVPSKSATVLRAGVECPSLSPDGTRIAFKQRKPGQRVEWRLAVLDLASLQDHPLAETRNVDDQAAWLDDATVTYGLATSAEEEASLSADQPGLSVLTRGGTLATDTWAVPADGSGAPRKILTGAWSSAPARH